MSSTDRAAGSYVSFIWLVMGFRLKLLTPRRAFTRFSTICPSQAQPRPTIWKVAELSPSASFASLAMDAGADVELVWPQQEFLPPKIFEKMPLPSVLFIQGLL